MKYRDALQRTMTIHPGHCRHHSRIRHVIHEVVCQHQIEIEVWPATAEVYFRDERHVDPGNTCMRFQAAVYNGRSGKVHWEVQDLDGNPGAGSIDSAGLYLAPEKGSLEHGTTEIVIATAAESPFRKAYAFVTLMGEGPELPPQPTVEIFPKRVNLYYPQGHDNAYIDESNTREMFQAKVRPDSGTGVEWLVDSVVQGGAGTVPWFLYQVGGSGAMKVVTVSVRLQGDPTVRDEATVIHLNYEWPGLV